MTVVSDIQANSSMFYQQGIYRLQNRRYVGQELLLRRLGQYNLPDMLSRPSLFVDHLSTLVEQKVRHAENLVKAGYQAKTFINMTPGQLCSPNFSQALDVLTDFHSTHAPLVVEVTENEVIENWQTCKEALKSIRDKGIGIAVDDFGAGHANMAQLIEIEPSYVKVDKGVIASATQCLEQENFMYSLVAFLHNVGVSVVLEGIELAEHLELALQSCADFGQGYLLQRPCPIQGAEPAKSAC